MSAVLAREFLLRLVDEFAIRSFYDVLSTWCVFSYCRFFVCVSVFPFVSPLQKPQKILLQILSNRQSI
jgi:hypothetical protein